MSELRWFRCHVDIVDDEKLGLLAFEDRWHYVAILACKAKGLIDQDDEFMRRKVQRKLGLTADEFEKAIDRLARVKLIDKRTLEPLGWSKRQYESDNSSERTRRYRERLKNGGDGVKRHSDVTVTPPETETDTELCSTQPKGKFQPEGVPNQLWADFVAVRKAKRAPITAASMQRLEREAAKANLSLQAAIQMCAERGWSSIDSSWEAVRQVAPRKSEFQSAY